MWVSAETIYQSLYVQSRGALRRELTRYLRTGRSLRKPGRRVGQRKNRIPDMVSIAERPPEADERRVAFGDMNSPQIPAVASGAPMPNTHCTAPLEVRDPH
jgi:IS30 family transposase